LDIRLGQIGDLGHQLADLVLCLLEQTWINGFFRHGGSRQRGPESDSIASPAAAPGLPGLHRDTKPRAAPAARIQRDRHSRELPEEYFPLPENGDPCKIKGRTLPGRPCVQNGHDNSTAFLNESDGIAVAECDLVTGGTGLLGSHLAERLITQGRQVRALVRQRSDTRYLESLGADLVVGDLADPESLAKAVAGTEVVYHAAAKVGDWGDWHEFQVGCLEATANLGRAAAQAGVKRFLHISSTSAYGHPPEGGPPINESCPLGQNLWKPWDYYTRSKVECERLLWDLAERARLPLTVIRPSWLYGERDRTTTARLIDRLRRGQVRLVGPGQNPLSAVYAGTVAEAAILAASDPASEGEAYNITNQGPISQQEFVNLFADACGAPRVTRRIPYRVVFSAAFLLELHGRLTRRREPPLISRYATWLMGRNLEYSTEKAHTRLGWQPSLPYQETIERSVRWFVDRERAAPSVAPTG
jgi:nucleoside-diphosphate-sugar epimerase